MMPLILDAKQFSMMAILLLFSPVRGLKQLYHPNQNTQVGKLKENGLYDRSNIRYRQYLGYGDHNDVEYDNHSKDELADLLTSKRDLNCLRRDRGDIMKLYASKNEFNFETVKGKTQDNIENRNQLRDGHLYVPQGFDPWSGTLNDIKPLIIFEDNHIIVVFKPPSILVQSDVTGSADNLYDAVKDYLKSSPDENSIRTYTDVAVCTDIPSINIDTAPNMLSQKNTEMEGKSHHIHLAGKVNEKRKKFGFLLKRSVTKIDENICEEDKNGNINGIIDTRTMRSFETFEKGEKLENSKEGEKAENSLNIRNLKNESQDFSMKISEDRNRNSDLFLIHRLDRPCSGVVVFAKTVSSANKLSELFKNRLTGKNYFCVVNGEVNQNQNLFHMIEKTQNSKVCIFDVDNDNINKLSSSDTDDNNNSNYSNKGNDNEKNKINLNIDKNKDKNKNNMKNSPHMELITAKLKFEKILTIAGGADRNDRQSVLKVELETGRKHQIRAQLSHIGHPIIGDSKYGARQSFKLKDIALHSYSLTIIHPVTNIEMTFRAGPPRIWGNRFGTEIIEILKPFLL